MRTGKVSETVLKRSVLKQINRRRAEVLVGPSVGEDCSVLSLQPGEFIVISTDPITSTDKDIGTLAVHITANDIASSGAEIIGIMVTILLPENAEESELKTIMKDIEAVCTELDIEIMGGHTEVTRAVNQTIITVTGVGKTLEADLINTAGAKEGQSIVMTKGVGLEGTAIIAKAKQRELITRYSQDFINGAIDFINHISVVAESKIAKKVGVSSMHDITEGGIYGALWEMGEASKVGIRVDLDKILIRQETIEISEFYGINPYKLMSSGSMIMITDHGQELVDELNKQGIEAAVIGVTIKGNKKIVNSANGETYLEPPKSDELYKVI